MLYEVITDPAVASAIVKYHMTERMRVVVNEGMDILAGRGICMVV